MAVTPHSSPPVRQPTRPRKLCGAGADEEDGGEYVLTPSRSAGSGRPSKHALKKERKAARRAKKHGGKQGWETGTAVALAFGGCDEWAGIG